MLVALREVLFWLRSGPLPELVGVADLSGFRRDRSDAGENFSRSFLNLIWAFVSRWAIHLAERHSFSELRCKGKHYF